MTRYCIRHGKIITPFRVLEGGTVHIEEDRITGVFPGDTPLPGAEEIDAAGMWVTPGFVDIHVHGGGGSDFMDATPEAFLRVAELHAAHGTTAMLPTTLAGTAEALQATTDAFREANRVNHRGARLCGLHLEGPYFSPLQAGAQDPAQLRLPDVREYSAFLQEGHCIRRWSAAPELPGMAEFARYARARGVILSAGHTHATGTQMQEAMEQGFLQATHMYSCMSGVRREQGYRISGVIESVLMHDVMAMEVIADGCHIPPDLLKMLWKTKGASRMALVTDAMRAAGMPPGQYMLGNHTTGQEILVEDGVAWLPGKQAFAGSVATGGHLFRTMAGRAGVPVQEVVQMLTHTPAAMAGLDGTLGVLAEGRLADIVIMNTAYNIQMTMIGGRIVCRKEG